MKFDRAILITMSFSVGCIVTGTITEKPLLKGVGEVAAIAAISSGVLVKQNTSDTNKQKQLTEFKKENSCLQTQLQQTQNELNKLGKKFQTQNTRQRLNLSELQKLQHQHKIVLKTIAHLECKLASNEKTASIKPDSSTQNSKETSIKPLTQSQESVTRVYIDGNNLNFALQELLVELDYDALRIELTSFATCTTFKYYTGVLEPVTEGHKRFIAYLKRLRYEVVELPVLHRCDSNAFKTVGDDVKIAVDMIGEVKSGDQVILVSGDGDFIPAIEEVQRRGVKVTVVAKKGMLSEQLSQIADDVVLLDDIQYKIAKYRKLNVA